MELKTFSAIDRKLNSFFEAAHSGGFFIIRNPMGLLFLVVMINESVREIVFVALNLFQSLYFNLFS